jgi:GR25 family glycosyltransferase involved in LPS biosynthesis
MKIVAIVLKNNPISEKGFKNLIKSSKDVGNNFKINRFDAWTPKKAHEKFNNSFNRLKWTYPWVGNILDIKSGLRLTAYKTNNPLARVACFLSHHTLWKQCYLTNEAFVILEHDALFLRKMPEFTNTDGYIYSLNDPRGATRMAAYYNLKLQESNDEITDCPRVDEDILVPQGLPGNSAYIITPKFAGELLEAVREYGCWPNDALICRQLFPNKLKCFTNYITRVQGLPSTTSL